MHHANANGGTIPQYNIAFPECFQAQFLPFIIPLEVFIGQHHMSTDVSLSDESRTTKKQKRPQKMRLDPGFTAKTCLFLRKLSFGNSR
jgi:hypothetical protein